ncbi:MAG TPA: hypothetical protein VGM08_00235 [Candidatus Saccharimonadales bacterium]|jgi:hypothetical protein
MDEDMLADLKQFIAAAVRQELSGMATKDDLDNQIGGLRSEMNAKFTEMDKRFMAIDGRFDDLDAKLEAIADAQAEALQDHEQRIARLESQAA